MAGRLRPRLIERTDRGSELLAASLVLAAGSVTVGLTLLVGAMVRHNRSIVDGFWLSRPFLYVQLIPNPGPFVGFTGGTARLARVLTVGVAVAIAVMLYRLAPCWRLANVSASIRIGLGIVLGGLISNVVELVWLGSATDFIGVPHDGVYSAGDLGLRIGATMVFAGWWADPKLWPDWLREHRIGWLWLVAAAGVVYLVSQYRRGVLGWAIVLTLGWLLGAAARRGG